MTGRQSCPCLDCRLLPSWAFTVEPLGHVVRLGKCLSVSPLSPTNSPYHLPPVVGSLSANSLLGTDPLGRGLRCYLWTDWTDERIWEAGSVLLF